MFIHPLNNRFRVAYKSSISLLAKRTSHSGSSKLAASQSPATTPASVAEYRGGRGRGREKKGVAKVVTTALPMAVAVALKRENRKNLVKRKKCEKEKINKVY